MSKRITYQLCSNDANKFSEVEFQPLIPWNCNRIKYKVKSVNTFANFLITTTDDFFSVYCLHDDKEYILEQFEDRISYEIDDILSIINDNASFPLTASLTSAGVLKFVKKDEFADKEITIENASYRIKLLFGLWSLDDIKQEIKDDVGFTCPVAPMLCYNNVLYLQSIHGNQICSRIDRVNYSPSVLYRINTFIKAGLPIILNKDKLGEEVEVNYDALNATSIKIKLVDFMFQDVILKSPLFICLEIEPVENTMIQVY